MTPLTLSNAQMSSAYNARVYPASNAIDSDMYTTLMASNYQANAWLSARVPSGTQIGLVAVYNRNDGTYYQNLLGSFDIWIGSSAGDRGVKCGSWTGATNSVGPFVINCGGVSSGEWVTLRQVGGARFLTITGFRAYAHS